MAKEILLDGGVAQEGAPKRWWEVYKLHWKCDQMKVVEEHSLHA